MNASLATIFRTIAAAGVACCIVGCATSPQTSPATLGAPSSASQARFTRSIHATASPPAAHAKPAGPGWISPAAASGQGLIYVANGGAVLIFPNSSQSSPVGTITTGVNGAYGIFVDVYLNVYVCNSAANTVTVYAPGQITPSSTYAMNLSRPLYAVADANRLFVGNANGGAIVEFALGNAQSGYTLQTLGAEVDGLALDRAGNLYAAYRTSDGDGAGGIEYFAGGTGAGRDLGITLDGPQGLLVDSKGNIFAVETQGRRCYSEMAYRRGDAFLFGPETRGLPPELVGENSLFIPMRGGNRSLNLANAVAVVVYEAWRQTGFSE